MRSLWAFGRIAIVAILALAALGNAATLAAQTTEGTVITNTATAAYTDANGNTYTDATGSVSVTVGFTAAITVTAGAAAATPGAGSTGNTMTFSITNPGNGTDSVSVNVTNSNTAGATIQSYLLDGTPMADLATLNAALAALALTPLSGNTTVVTVVYDVPVGATVTDVAAITLTATSRRDAGETNSGITTVTPGGVIVTADAATTSQLPSGTGPTSYTVTYQVTNQSSVAADIDLSTTVDGTNAASVTVTGVDDGGAVHPAADTTITFSAGQLKTITATYTVGNAAPVGANTTITLSATAAAVSGSPSDSDNTVLTVLRPVLTITKTVHASSADANSNTVLVGDPVPGQTIWYKVVVDNSTGTAAADVTGMTDDFSGLPVAYTAASLDDTGSATAWTSIGQAGGIITGTVTIPAGSTASFIFSVSIN